MKLSEVLTESAKGPRWERDPKKDGYAVYDAKGKLYTVYKWKSPFDGNAAYEEAQKTVAFLKTFPLGKKDKTPKFIDDDGEVYKLVLTTTKDMEHLPGTTIHVVTNHWWKTGNKQVLVFVETKNKKWTTSPDGGFGTPEVKTAYWDEKAKKD